jgi:hypothetical protein
MLAYYRIGRGEKYLVLLNMSKSRPKSPLDSEVLLSTHAQGNETQLQPFEGRVMRAAYH